jgi:tetratricopeptide (TPR) repeat protein
LLDAIWDGAEPIDMVLPALTSLEFLRPRSEDGESVYVFKHALTQDVAYGTLSADERRRMHAAAGRALERFYEGRLQEVYDRLAYHYARTDDAAKAIDYLARFADRSARAYAHGEAVEALTEAAGYVERLPAEARDRTTVGLALQRSLSLLPLGRIGEILSTLLDQRDRLARLQEPTLAGRYHFLLARAYMLADHTLVVENARRAIAEAERCGDNATVGGAYGVLAVACALSGEAARGIDCGQRAVMLLEKTEEQRSLSYAYWALGMCCSQTGAFEDGMVAERRALAIAEAIGDPPMEVSAGWGVGIIQAARGDWDEGIASCQRAVQRARHVLYRALANGFLGFAYMEKADAEPAIAALEQAIPLVQRFGLKAFEGWFTAFLAEAHRLEGRLDRAEALAVQALEIASAANFPVAIGWAQQSLGRIAWARGDAQTAQARLGEAVTTFTRIHSRYEVARTQVDLARLAWACGDRDVAGRYLRGAHSLFVTLDVPRYRERLERLATDWGTPLTVVTR